MGLSNAVNSICKLLIKNSYHLVIVGYLYRKRLVGQIQNALMADSGTLRVDTRLQKRYADTWRRVKSQWIYEKCSRSPYNQCITFSLFMKIFFYVSSYLSRKCGWPRSFTTQTNCSH